MRAFYLFFNLTSGRRAGGPWIPGARSAASDDALPPIRPGAFARWAAMAEIEGGGRVARRTAQDVGQAASPSRAPEASRP